MHPEVLKKYKENDFEIALERAEDINGKNFFDQAKQSKAEIKHEITKIMRIRKSRKEYFYYGEALKSRNYLGNPIHLYRTIGKYDDPIFRSQVDPSTGNKMAVEIESTETVYEFEWPKQWTDELEEKVTESVDLLIITPGRKYGGFTFSDFKEKSFDELVTIGKFGTSNPVIIKELEKKPAKTR